MRVISVDLAYKHYSDVGVVVLEASSRMIAVVPMRLEAVGLAGTPNVSELGSFLASIAGELGACSILIDGPQAWMAPDSELEHSRRCERDLNTPGKMGLPGMTKPATYHDFAVFSIALFDDLNDLSFPRLATTGTWPTHVAIESFPTSAWRSLGLTPLPAKRKSNSADIAAWLDSLRGLFDLDVRGDLNHDELQATVAGLAGVALERRNTTGIAFAGVDPFVVQGTWREGYILNPTPDAVVDTPRL
jgi:hypothetical protein